jgi:hypothetical protein
LHHLKADTEGLVLLVPVGTEEFEAAYLRGGAHMLTDAGTYVIVTDAHEADGLGGIFRETFEREARVGRVRSCIHYYTLQFGTGDILEGDGHVLLYQFIHRLLNLSLFFAVRLMVDEI